VYVVPPVEVNMSLTSFGSEMCMVLEPLLLEFECECVWPEALVRPSQDIGLDMEGRRGVRGGLVVVVVDDVLVLWNEKDAGGEDA
jgi:hypothetical protein